MGIYPDDGGMTYLDINPDDGGMIDLDIDPDDGGMTDLRIDPDDGVTTDLGIDPDDGGMTDLRIDLDDGGMTYLNIDPDNGGMTYLSIDPDDERRCKHVYVVIHIKENYERLPPPSPFLIIYSFYRVVVTVLELFVIFTGLWLLEEVNYYPLHCVLPYHIFSNWIFYWKPWK